jgi:hypothetical protein
MCLLSFLGSIHVEDPSISPSPRAMRGPALCPKNCPSRLASCSKGSALRVDEVVIRYRHPVSRRSILEPALRKSKQRGFGISVLRSVNRSASNLESPSKSRRQSSGYCSQTRSRPRADLAARARHPPEAASFGRRHDRKSAASSECPGIPRNCRSTRCGSDRTLSSGRPRVRLLSRLRRIIGETALDFSLR